eukprot:jgi/Botrbrau1/20042/Bobra.200_1s0047.1
MLHASPAVMARRQRQLVACGKTFHATTFQEQYTALSNSRGWPRIPTCFGEVLHMMLSNLTLAKGYVTLRLA